MKDKTAAIMAGSPPSHNAGVQSSAEYSVTNTKMLKRLLAYC